MFDKVLKEALLEAEKSYDRMVRRWGNIPFARSCVYDWVWSDEFELLCSSLTPRDSGRVRLMVLSQFQVKPWPWYPAPQRSQFDAY